MLDKTFYSSVISQTFSPCGKYLVCGNDFGDIAVFDVDDVMSKRCSETKRRGGPELLLKQAELGGRVSSLCSTRQFLIAGSPGFIFGWTWESLTSPTPESVPPLAWKIKLPTLGLKRAPDVNSLLVQCEDEMPELYAGCGDNGIHVYSLEDGKLVRTFNGHTDYVHSIAGCDGVLGSCSEDGTVRLWDTRQKTVTSVLEPSGEPLLARPSLGKWLAHLDINPTSLVCCGGARAGLWDLRKLELRRAFEETDDSGLYLSMFCPTEETSESVLLGGNMASVLRLSQDGEKLSRIEPPFPITYSAVFRKAPLQMVSLAGSSQKILLSTDLENSSQILSFFEELQ